MSVRSNPSVTSQDILRHARSHTEYNRQLFETGLFSDCTIACQNRSWHLHRAFLALRCGFFKACFSNNFQESYSSGPDGSAAVLMHEDDPDALDRMLRWLYTLEYPSQMENVLPNSTRTATTSNDQKDMYQFQEVDLDSARLRKDEGSRLKSKNGQILDVVRDAPQQFWTRELSLFVVADKYNLPDLAVQVAASIEEAVRSYSNVDSLKADCESPLSRFGDFLDMLEVLYAELPSASLDVRQLQKTLVCRSAMILAAHANQQPRISDLMMAVPVLATDLVEALRQIVEVHAGQSNDYLPGHNAAPMAGSVCSSRSSSAGSIYASGSETGVNAPSHTTARSKSYIPMNEDSDTD